MVILALLLLSLVIGLGFFLYRNYYDERDVQQLLRETKAEDDERDRTSVL